MISYDLLTYFEMTFAKVCMVGFNTFKLKIVIESKVRRKSTGCPQNNNTLFSSQRISTRSPGYYIKRGDTSHFFKNELSLVPDPVYKI